LIRNSLLFIKNVKLKDSNVYFAKKIYDLLENSSKDVDLETPSKKIYY